MSNEAFVTGAVRDTAAGKPKMSLLPPWVWTEMSPLYGSYVERFLLTHDISYMQELMRTLLFDFGIERFCNHLERGAKVYDAWNWAKGIPISRCLDSLGRHLFAITLGKTDEDHGAAAMCNVGFIVHYVYMINQGMMASDINDMFEFDRMKTSTGGAE